MREICFFETNWNGFQSESYSVLIFLFINIVIPE